MFVCTNPKFNYMKKVVLFIALVATSVVGAQAQKFQGGEKNLEVEFNPFGGSPIGMPNGFRFRMFANNADDQSKPENWVTWDMTVKNGSSSFGLNALAGVDFYFADNFYLGAEISLGFHNTSYKDRETTAGDEDAWKYSGIQFDPLTGAGDPDFYQATWNVEETEIEYQTIIGPGGIEVDEASGFSYEKNSPTKHSGWGPNFQSTLRLGWLF